MKTKSSERSSKHIAKKNRGYLRFYLAKESAEQVLFNSKKQYTKEHF